MCVVLHHLAVSALALVARAPPPRLHCDATGGDGSAAPQLPSAGGTEPRSLQVDGESLELGPLVVTEDGQYRYISNWVEMTDAEKEVTRRRISKRNAERLKRLRGGALAAPPPASIARVPSEPFNGFQVAVRHMAAAPGHEEDDPLLLIHPVGIGLASWFWEPFLGAWKGGDVWAFDLVGCGESDPWNPDEKGLFIPLDWVRQAESLWREHINKPVVVVAQGGLAPIGVYLASRETDSWSGSRAVRSLILASPPSWEEIAKDSDSAEVERNFRWMASPLGALSYRLLRTRAFVEFFSNLFLFDKELGAADERWLREACDGATLEARWPVLAFNAGLVGCAGLETQLRSLTQPLLVLSGAADRRVTARREFADAVPACRLESLSAGCNVLPWESPDEFARTVAAFAQREN